MELIYFIISLVITGAIIGALGRLAIPGPNPMSIGMTILVGIGGAFLGGIVGALLAAGPVLIFILEVLGAALIVYLMQRRTVRPRTY
ncbi:MAG: GlsB/YeaQ/YmgE family stress response membrane protein [Actinomycetota bacterium]|nr:GlsB/YeaQ/YmgE family stress response membrane protein [Actinomycetota bacterium]